MAESKLYGSVLIKAATILDVLAQTQHPMTLNEIALACQFTLSTTSKILTTLLSINYVYRNDNGKKYTLGSRLIYLANAAFLQFDIVRETYPALKYLHDQFQETVHLGRCQDNKILYVNKLSSPTNNQEMRSRIGYTQNLYCSAMGKAILATFDTAKQDTYFKSEDLVARTPHTIIDVAMLRQQLETIRENGFALDEQEAEDGIFCVGASLQIQNAASDYAFSISVPYGRLTEKRQKEMIAAVIKTKNILEFQLQS